MPASGGLSLSPLRGLRFTAGPQRLGRLLCPPYDVIDDATRTALLAADPDNAVQVVLPRDPDGDPYQRAADTLRRWSSTGVVAVDDVPALYVYEMRSRAADEPCAAEAASSAETAPDPTDPADPADPAPASGVSADRGRVTRGLLGAVELRDPDDGVILPHENTMAGPVADRLALMDATDANLEPIYLVYDGGGAASRAVASVEALPLLADATTPDGIRHRLWAITDPATLADVAADLNDRTAMIADGHHRYATYRQLAHQRGGSNGPGPWDRGLALLVDGSAYGPQVHSIHRVVPGLGLPTAIDAARATFRVQAADSLDGALGWLEQGADTGFGAVVTDGARAVTLSHPDPAALTAARRPGEPTSLLDLDVTVLHRVLVQSAWGLTDDEHHVGYAHNVAEALGAAVRSGGVAVLLRPTPVAAVAAVAAAGARMPRKSTFFTPKPASGLVMRRFADQR